MTEHNRLYYPYTPFTNAQLPLLKVAELYFEKLVILVPVGASWATIGADHQAREAIIQLQDVGILQTVTPADVLAQDEQGIDRHWKRPISLSTPHRTETLLGCAINYYESRELSA